MDKEGKLLSYETLSFQELKKGRVEHIDTSRVVCIGPVFLLDWEITAKANGTGVLKFYDGMSAADPLRMEIQVTKSSTLCQNYNWPRYFNRGLYLGFGGDVYHICIHYLMDPTL